MEAERAKLEPADVENLAIAAGYESRAIQESAGAQNILLVEDETLVREVIYEVLQTAGFSVRKSRNAEEALELQKGRNETVHLLLTDVILPGSSGKDLARKLRSRYPRMKTIFMSGYARNTALLGADRDANVSFLSKPFSVEALLRKVEESFREEFAADLGGKRRL
jgi:two-component system, cell cycle sensor histidine kinase and response regulator CckA